MDRPKKPKQVMSDRLYRNGVSGPVLNPICPKCGLRVPAGYLVSGGCYDCVDLPPQTIALSRSLVDIASRNSSIQRGEHDNGEI